MATSFHEMIRQFGHTGAWSDGLVSRGDGLPILRTAMMEAGERRSDTAPVRLALRTLWTHCSERWPLVSSGTRRSSRTR